MTGNDYPRLSGIFFINALLFAFALTGCSTPSPAKITDPNSLLAVCKTIKELPENPPISIPYEGFAIFAWFEKARPDALPEAVYLTRRNLVTDEEWKILPPATANSRASCTQAVQIHGDFQKMRYGAAAYVTENSAPWFWKYNHVLVFKRSSSVTKESFENIVRSHTQETAKLLGDLKLWGYVAYPIQDYEIDFLTFSNEAVAKEALTSQSWNDFLKRNENTLQLVYSFGSAEVAPSLPGRGKITKIGKKANRLSSEGGQDWRPGDPY